jgi:hypothetical protein
MLAISVISSMCRVLILGYMLMYASADSFIFWFSRGSLYRILHRPQCQIDEKRRIKMALDVV